MLFRSDNCIQHEERILVVEFGAGLGGGVNDVRVFAARKVEAVDVAFEEGDGGFRFQVRKSFFGRIRIAGQDRGGGI